MKDGWVGVGYIIMQEDGVIVWWFNNGFIVYYVLYGGGCIRIDWIMGVGMVGIMLIVLIIILQY